MIAEALTKLRDLIATPHTVVFESQGRVYLPAGWSDGTPKRPSVTPVEVSSLEGLLGYLRAVTGSRTPDATGPTVVPDWDATGPIAVHVKAHDQVLVLGRIEHEDVSYRRNVYCRASLDLVGPPPVPFGTYVESEIMMIALMSGFAQTPARDELIQLLASIKESSVRETIDDGVGQEVKTGRGVTLVGVTKVQNPWILAPFRTFREIEQPASPFIVRLQSKEGGDKPRVALFEAEGNRWKLRAMESIKFRLLTELERMAIPLIA